MEWECFKKGIVYKSTILNPITKEELANYIGMTGRDPKHQVSLHDNSFSDMAKIKKTKLTEDIWRMKDEGIPFKLKWGQLADAQPRKANQKICNLCC